jgi:integrase
MLRVLLDYAMWADQLPISRNPMELVRVHDATKRMREPRSLTPTEFQQFITKLAEPFRTVALVSVCCGLRVSEATGLRWSDINWLEGKVRIQRGVVNGITDDVKTVGSRKPLRLSTDLMDVLKLWRASSEFTAESDWIFASPIELGLKPWSAYTVRRAYAKAARAAGIGKLATHSLRHTFRSWLDATGTPISVQQKAMRHSSIKTTMDHYGDIVTDELAQAFDKVAAIALNGR